MFCSSQSESYTDSHLLWAARVHRAIVLIFQSLKTNHRFVFFWKYIYVYTGAKSFAVVAKNADHTGEQSSLLLHVVRQVMIFT